MKVIMIAVAKLVSFVEKNYGRHANLVDTERDRHNRAVMLAEYGWDMTQVIDVVKITMDEMLKQSYARREERYKSVDALTLETTYTLGTGEKVKLSADQLKGAFKLTYRKSKSEDWEQPTHENVFAFQRLDCLFEANAIRIFKGLEPITSIPCQVVEFANEWERMESCASENIRKNLGVKDPHMMHWPTLLKIGYEYLTANPSAGRSDIQRIIAPAGAKGATRKSQKIWPILVLNSRFPELKIVETILAKGINDKGVDTAQAYMQAIKEDDFLKPLVEGTDSERDEATDEATEDEVAEYFANPFTAEVPKPISAKEIANLMKTLANKKTIFILKALSKKTQGKDAVNMLKRLDAFAKEDNETMEAAGLLEKPAPEVTKEPIRESIGTPVTV